MLRPLALLLAITVSGHYPDRDMLDSCTVSQAPNTDIAVMRVFQQVRHQQPRVYLVRNCAGLQGQAFTFTVPPDTEAVYWCEVSDFAGNVLHFGACQGPNPVQVALTTAVPPGQMFVSNPTPAYFDVLGRRLDAMPTRTGIYWEHLGAMVRRFRIVK